MQMIHQFHKIISSAGWEGDLIDGIEELPKTQEFVEATLDLLAQDNPSAEYFLQHALDIDKNHAIIKLALESQHRNVRSRAFELLNDMDYFERKDLLRSWIVI